MEIEAKYRVLRPVDAAEIARLDLAPYRLADGDAHDLHDTILDTPDRAITGAGCGLRLRRDGPRTLLTFKGVGTVEGAVHRRAEYEAELPEPTLERAAWPPEIDSWVRHLADDRPVWPLLDVRNHRRTWRVLRDNRPVAELAFDEGRLLAGTAEEPFRELELELQGAGDDSVLAALDARLRATLPLEPEPRSKLARALALLERTRATTAVPEVGAADAEPGAAPSDAPTSAAARPIALVAREHVRHNLERLRQAEAVARAGTDPEGVHAMRVASRRIRTALGMLTEAGIAGRRVARFRRRLRRLARALGTVRDLDVLLERVRADAATPPALLDELATRWAAAHADLVRTLDARKTRALLDALQGWAAAPPASGAPRPGRPTLLRHTARSAIWRRYEDVLTFEALMPAPPDTLHRLRIAVKRLRYTLEFFADALGGGARALRRELAAIQDHLGDLQDQATALALLDELLERRPSAAGLAAHRARRQARQAELAAAFAPLWASLSGADFAHRLARALAAV